MIPKMLKNRTFRDIVEGRQNQVLQIAYHQHISKLPKN